MKNGKRMDRYTNGAIPPIGHYDSSENTTDGTFGKPKDKAPKDYHANESVPSMDRHGPCSHSKDNPGDLSKKFA